MPATRASRPLCICGRSATAPFCDGSHDGEGWACSGEEATGPVFAASPRYENLARKLAGHHGGRVWAPGSGDFAATRLILLLDGFDLEVPRRARERVAADSVEVVSLGLDAALLAGAFPGARIRAAAADPLGAFSAVNALLAGEAAAASPAPATLRAGFLSHAVADEPSLLPVVETLRAGFGADLFLCADSIPGGSDWQATIDAALRDAPVFVLLLSVASAASHFCAYEAGVARGLGKDLRVISLDGTAPPAFLQHVQAAELPRKAAARPWLDPEDLLLEELLGALAG